MKLATVVGDKSLALNPASNHLPYVDYVNRLPNHISMFTQLFLNHFVNQFKKLKLTFQSCTVRWCSQDDCRVSSRLHRGHLVGESGGGSYI